MDAQDNIRTNNTSFPTERKGKVIMYVSYYCFNL